MKVPMRFGLCAALAVFAITGVAASPALAGEAHPIEHTGFETDTFSNPNGIAVEESTADVYVAELGTNTVSKFDANGKPVNFTCGAPCSTYVTGNQITGTPSGSFLFPNEPGDRNPAAIAVDNSTSASDPSAGDLYVMDAGHKVIDKFSPSGVYLSQITGPFSGTAGELLGFGVDASGDVRVDVNPSGTSFGLAAIDVFDSSVANNFVAPLVESGNGGTLPGVSEGGFAVAPSGDSYLLLSCGCLEKFGPHMAELGRVDGGPADVAAAVDPATGHVYVDDQSSVDEWDTGAMNRKTHTNEIEEQGEETPSGALVSSFGSLQLSSSSGQGGISQPNMSE